MSHRCSTSPPKVAIKRRIGIHKVGGWVLLSYGVCVCVSACRCCVQCFIGLVKKKIFSASSIWSFFLSKDKTSCFSISWTGDGKFCNKAKIAFCVYRWPLTLDLWNVTVGLWDDPRHTDLITRIRHPLVLSVPEGVFYLNLLMYKIKMVILINRFYTCHIYSGTEAMVTDM